MPITIHDVIALITAPVGQLEQTVDALMFGDPHTEVSGIVTTLMATQRLQGEFPGVPVQCINDKPVFVYL